MRSSPIYNIIEAQGRKSDPSFGARGGFTQDIRVGRSSTDSHTLAEVEVREIHDHASGSTQFVLLLDGKIIKRAIHHKGHCHVFEAEETDK